MTTQLLEYKGNQFVDELSNVVVYICLAAAILSTVYAVYIAYLFFTASDQNKRKAAKDRLIKTIASCLIIFTAAAILKSLDIKFVKEGLSDGNYDGPKEPVIQTYHYDGNPLFNLVKTESKTVHGGVKIDYYEGKFNFGSLEIIDDIKKESVSNSGMNIRIISCNIVNPSNWLPNSNDKTEDGSIRHSPDNDDSVEFNYSAKYSGRFNFPCIQDENDNKLYVMAKVDFLMYSDEDLGDYEKNSPEAISYLMGLAGTIKTVYIKAEFQPDRDVYHTVSYTL